ncbi:MAG: zf-HC2 domain-containing protein [Acidobacteriaceae bacterium]
MADESKFGQKPGSTLKCEEWEAQLTDALDGLLPAREAAAFAAHSDTCANCGDLLAHSKQGREWLGYLHTEPEIPAGLIAKILEQTVGAGSVPLPVIAAAGASGGAVAMATPWHRNFHETRLLMTVAMAFFSIALTLNLVGVKWGNLRLADLRPSQIGSTLSREFFTARGSVVRYYDNMRFFYQLQSRMRELRRDVETQPQQQQQQPANQQQQKPGGKNGSATAAPERGSELNAKQRSAFSDQHSEDSADERSVFRGQHSEESGLRAELRAASTEKSEEAAEVGVSVGTGRFISLGETETGLQEAAEAVGYVEGSLV